MAVNYPTFASAKFDSKTYTEEQDDPAMRNKMEGGYTITRPRYSRIRKTFSFTYRSMTEADKATMQTFWGTTKGGSEIINWTNPYNNTVYQVRFLEKLQWTQVGAGTLKLWDCAVKLEQV